MRPASVHSIALLVSITLICGTEATLSKSDKKSKKPKKSEPKKSDTKKSEPTPIQVGIVIEGR